MCARAPSVMGRPLGCNRRPHKEGMIIDIAQSGLQNHKAKTRKNMEKHAMTVKAK